MTIYITAAHDDSAHLDTLLKHCKVLEADSTLQIRTKNAIKAGADRAAAIRAELETAHLIVMLLSANFISDEECYNEMQVALHRREHKKTDIIPIYLSSYPLEETAIAKYLILPRNKQPILSAPSTEHAKIYTDIVKEMQEMIQKFKAQQKPPKGIPSPRMDWQSLNTDECLRPTFTKTLLKYLFADRRSINLTGGSGQGKSRQVEDLKNCVKGNGFKVATINLKEHRKSYKQFLMVIATQLGFINQDFQAFDEVLDQVTRHPEAQFLIVIDNLEVLNDYTENDKRYDAHFVSSLNFLKNTDNTLLLCVSQVWLKGVIFNGETSLLALQPVEINPLSETDIQNEFKRKLDPSHPFLQKPNEQREARKAVKVSIKPVLFLDNFITRLETHYQHETFKTLLNNAANYGK